MKTKTCVFYYNSLFLYRTKHCNYRKKYKLPSSYLITNKKLKALPGRVWPLPSYMNKYYTYVVTFSKNDIFSFLGSLYSFITCAWFFGLPFWRPRAGAAQQRKRMWWACDCPRSTPPRRPPGAAWQYPTASPSPCQPPSQAVAAPSSSHGRPE